MYVLDVFGPSLGDSIVLGLSKNGSLKDETSRFLGENSRIAFAVKGEGLPLTSFNSFARLFFAIPFFWHPEG